MADVDLLIVGAGPFGLSIAAQAGHLGIDYLVLGEPMGFWRRRMPRGMVLRSSSDWHYDPQDEATLVRYFAEQGLTPAEVEPIPLETYIPYGDWFRERKGIKPQRRFVERLDLAQDGAGFLAMLADGETIAARRVALALGFEYFRHIPAELAALMPPGRSSHTCEAVDLGRFAGQRVLIVGGRQSAFEWAALLAEAGATAVHLSHRHPSPVFTFSDWDWTTPLVEHMINDPGWYRHLPDEERRAVDGRMWGEGRLKLEPWLEPRVQNDRVHRWPSTRLDGVTELADGSLAVRLDSGEMLEIDHVILATGYKVDMARIPFLAVGNALPHLAVEDGYPLLDEHFQTSVPGLFATSIAASRAFGPFFGFTRAVRTSAILIGQGLA